MLHVCKVSLFLALFVVSACDNSSNLPAALQPNTAPVGASASVTTNEDVALMAALSASDPDGDDISVSITDDVDDGSLVITPDGAGGFNASYTPNPNFNGTDAFSFTVSDGRLSAGPFTVNITVVAVNDVPVANDAAASTDEDGVVNGTLSAVDADNDMLTFMAVATPGNGTVLVNTDGSYTYTPSPDFNGVDQFSFTANDGVVDSGTATVTVTVTAVNDAPVGGADNLATNEDMPLSAAAPGVLGNDTDVDGDALTATIASPPSNGVLMLNADGSFVYSPNSNFNGMDTFTYLINDGSVNSTPVTATITISAVNDPPVATALNVTTMEDTAINTQLSGSDIENDPLMFVLMTMPANGTISGFDPVNGILTYTPNANFSGIDSFMFSVNDGAASSMNTVVMINVTPVNDVPTAIALDNTSVDEEQAAGTVVGALATTDADTSDTHTYALVAGTGDTDNASFLIVGNTIQTAVVIDFEIQNSFSLRVQTDDGAGGTLAQVFVITVNDLNDAPTDISLSNDSVDENQPAGTTVGTLASTDIDTAGPFTYALVAGTGDADNASFAIIGDQLQSAAVFDFETQDTYFVRVQTDDGAGGTFEEAFTITINDINDAPADIALSNSGINENLPAGSAVGVLTSVDVDSAGPFTYALVAGVGDTDNASFAIVGDQLQSAAVFDFETQNSYSIRIQTDDGAGGVFEEAFIINVNDLNDAPTDIALDSTDVDENQAVGTPVGNLSSTDVDSAAFTYALVAGAGDTDNAAFAIAGGVLQTAAMFDFETQNSYSIRVQTDDGAGGTFEEAFTITVSNINDAPTDIALDSTDVDENQAVGTPVGNLSSTDVDSAAFTYALVAGAGDTDNASFAVVGGVLQTAAALDFETQNSYSIRVQTDDGAGGTFEEAFTITVNDLNDAPTDIALDSTDVDENQPAGTSVGNLNSTDMDSAAFTYALVAGAGDTDNGAFAIAGGVLQTAAGFDFETQNSYAIRIQTDDGAGGLFEKAFIITVNDLNDAPTDIALDSTDVDENQPAGTAVGTFSSTDVDSAAFTYTLVAGAGDTGNVSFTIAAGVLQTANLFDFESQGSFSIRVQTDDGAGGLFEEVFTITVNNLNDAPFDIGLDNASVTENQPTGTAVGSLTSIDQDALDTHTYSLVAGAGATDNAQFAIVGDQLQTAAVLDFETAANCTTSATTCSIRVQTDDGNGGVFQKAFVISITDANDNPTGVALGNSSVNENEPIGTGVGLFSTTDQDTLDTHTYTLVAGTGDTDNSQFMIVGNQLQTAFVLDFETASDCTTSASTCSIRVQTDDGNGGVFSDVFIITIIDVLEPNASPVAVNDSYTGGIGNTNFALVAALSGASTPPTVQLIGTVIGNDTDADAGDTLSATADAAIATTQGGTVALDAAGRFVYTPAAGFPSALADSFDYEVCDDGTPIMCDTGTVTIQGSNIVWYVDDSSPNNPGTGTASDPFRDLASAGGPSSPGDTIFVFAGTQTTGAALQNNQSLLGEGVALVVGPVTLVNAGTRPVIANAGGAAIMLASGNTVRGLDISGSQQGIVGSGFGTLTADTVAISTSGGPGIDLSNGAGSLTFDSLSSTSSTTSGIDLDSVSGSFTLGGGSISGSSGPGIDITSSTATVSYSGSVTAGSNLAVNISGQSANSVSLGGLISSSGQGILLNNNGGGTINLSGGMSLSTGAFSAFSATNGGTVNVTGTNALTTTTGTAAAISNTTIGGSGITFESITSTAAGTNAGIILNNTGSGDFTVSGTGGTCAVGTATCSGGRIANKTGDAVTLNDTGGRVTLTAMLIEDIGATGGGFNTRSQHDAIHGEDVLGGLTLDNTLIRRISDMCINGALFAGGVLPTNWVGLDILNSTIEDCNRFHVSGTGDTSDEGAVRIVGLTGTVTVNNSTIQRAGELMDLFTAPTGTLNMTVTNSDFFNAFKEFTSGPTVAIGKSCIDVTVEGSSDANVTIGGSGTFPNNEFINCGTASVRVSKDTTPAGNSDIDVIVDNNLFRVTDQTSANGVFGNTPQGGVALRAGPGGINTYDALVSNNTFGVAVGPDDRIGSTTDEVANADGVPGNVALIFERGASQARVNNNTFNGPINAPWANRADGNTSAKVLYMNNSYRGRDDYCCDSGFTFTVPGIPYRTDVRNGGAMDITLRNDNFVHHDQFFFAQTETIEMNSNSLGGGGTLNVCLDGVTSGDGFEFDEDAGTINLYQGAVNNAVTGPCVVEADGHAVSACELEVADDGVRGGPNGHAQSGAPTPALNPPHIDIDGGAITITGTACQEPSGGIF